MSIDLIKFLERSALHYDQETLDIVDEDAIFVASLGRPSLILPTDSLIHAQGRLLASAPELWRCLEELLSGYDRHCPSEHRNEDTIKRTYEVLNSFYGTT